MPKRERQELWARDGVGVLGDAVDVVIGGADRRRDRLRNQEQVTPNNRLLSELVRPVIALC